MSGRVSLRGLDGVGDVPAARGSIIRSVEPVLLSHQYPEDDAPRWSGGRLPGVSIGLVRVTTTDGLEGIGETYAGVFVPEAVRAIVEFLAPILVGRDASEIEANWQRCANSMVYWGRSGLAMSVLSGVESALWDLCGKAVGQPVHALLGGKAHDRLPRYASGGTSPSFQSIREETTRYAADGYLAAKIRGGVDPVIDRGKVEAALDGIGPGGRIALDAVQGSNPRPWDSATAIAAGRALEDLDLLWFEEPCGAADVDGYAACRRELRIPIAGGESCTTFAEFSAYFEADALDIVQPDASHVGGILVMRRVAAVAESRGLPMAVHAWAAGACLMANYHVAFASPNAAWLEFPTAPNPLVRALLVEELRVEDGQVLAPTAAGLGVVLTPEVEARFPFVPGRRFIFEDRRQSEVAGK